MCPESFFEFVTHLRGNVLYIDHSNHFQRLDGDYAICRETSGGIDNLLVYPTHDLSAELRRGIGDKIAGVYGRDGLILPSRFLKYVGLGPDSKVRVIVYDSEIIEILNPKDTERFTAEFKERLKQLATSLSQRGI